MNRIQLSKASRHLLSLFTFRGRIKARIPPQIAANAANAPIFRLPTEILAVIFWFALEEKPDSDGKLRSYEAIAQTCHVFRGIILEMPEAWRIIDIPLFWPLKAISKYVSAMKKRARYQSICIFVRDGGISAWNSKILNLIPSLFADITSVDNIIFHISHSSMASIPKAFVDALPTPPHALMISRVNIQKVSRNYSRLQLSKPTDDSLTRCPLPSGRLLAGIRAIHLIDVNMEWGRMDRGIRLELRSFTYECKRFKARKYSATTDPGVTFVQSPRLERLWVRRFRLPNIPSDPTSYIRPALRELYIYNIRDVQSFEMIQGALILPNLVKFGTTHFRTENLCAFLHSHPTITELTFGYAANLSHFPSKYMKRVSQACTKITKLNLASQWMLGFADAKSTFNPYGLFPSVEHLEFDDGDFIIPMDVFERLVEARIIMRDRSKTGQTTSMVPNGQEDPVQIRLEERVRRVSRLTIRHEDSECTVEGRTWDPSLVFRSMPWMQSRYISYAEIHWKEDACHMYWSNDVAAFM